MGVVVSAIQFNHGPASGALNLRKNRSQVVSVPEWRLGENLLPDGSPVAYAVESTRGRQMTIRVRLARTDLATNAVYVRAIQPPQPELPWWEQYLSPPDLLWPQHTFFQSYYDYLNYSNYTLFYQMWQALASSSGNVLGEVKPRLIEFGTDRETGFEIFELQNVRLASRGVGVQDMPWLWQYRLPSEILWRNIGLTWHRVYTVLDRPTLPWTEQPFSAANTQLPWTDVLDFSCTWAAGVLNVRDAAERITATIFDLGAGLLEYGCPIGAIEMYANTLLNGFDCSAFLERLRGGAGNGPYVNCTDCATIASTFANILGSDLWQSRMGMYVPDFETFPSLIIGSNQWQSPCGWGLGFTYHEVAWTGECTSQDEVYDPCLLVDARPPIINRLPEPLLVSNMRFGQPGDGQYRDRLTVPEDRAICAPRPFERRRRTVF